MTKTAITKKPQQPIEAMVSYDRIGYQRLALSDITAHGAFVQIPEPRLLKISTPVKVALKLQNQVKTDIYFIKGHIHKIQRDGAEIRFYKVDLKTYSALLRLESGKTT